LSNSTILIADDDAAIRTVLNQALGRAGYDVRATSNAATLWKWVSEGEGNLVITDVVMPDENGLDLLPRIKKIRPELKVIVMSAQNTLMTAVNATQRGAFEYLPKPFDLNELLHIVARALQVKQNNSLMQISDAETEEQLPLLGRSIAMQEVYRSLARLMDTDLTVLITGDSGTGKELAARALHDYGNRKNFSFVAINMAAIPRELIESELFGHEKGSFTGAINHSTGRFKQAEGGTLFLDEIGDMPAEAQTRLLRVLQEGEFTSVGGREAIRTDVRIVAATHRDLTQLIRQGLFREDLYYRLNVVPIRMPPLKERREDIPELVKHFLAKSSEEGLPWKMIDQQAMEKLQVYDWPGNVRELENAVRRLAALYSQETIGVDVIEAELSEKVSPMINENSSNGISEAVETHILNYFATHNDTLPVGGLYNKILKEVERPLIANTLAFTRGNQLKSAELLGLNRNTLRKKIQLLNIPVIRAPK
jgi:two-component system, NtrC family, nitrogen regulation response regulator GlnG